MSLTAKFYNCADAPNTFEKTLTPANPNAVVISNYETINDITGYLYLQSGKINFNYILLNGKYYFVGPREYLTNGMCRVFLSEDVLQTFKSGISDLPVVVARNKVWKATEMFDGELRTLARTACFSKVIGTFSYDLSNKILVTVG